MTVTTRSGDVFTGGACIVTVPLGVLREGSIRFEPALGPSQRSAIAALRMGTLDKVILKYDEPWWDSKATQLGVVGRPVGQTVSAFNFEPVSGLPILVAFTGARYARTLESLDDDALAGTITALLASGFGRAAADPVQTAVTRWSRDKWTLGSYSHIPPGASPQDRAALARPAGRVVLAGEHTSVERPSTMDGAYLSGRRAAALAAGVRNA